MDRKRRQSPFWTVSGRDPSKRFPASSNWIRVSFSGRQSPFWTVSGLDPSKRFPAASNWASGHLFGPSAVQILQQGFQQPYWTKRHASGHLFQAVTAWIGHLLAPCEVAAPVGTAASSILGIRYSGLPHLSASNELCLLCFFYSLSCFSIRLHFHGGEDL